MCVCGWLVEAALADGFALFVVELLGLTVTGAGVNPVRSLCSGLVNGGVSDYRTFSAVYVGGPLLGSVGAVLVQLLLHGRPTVNAIGGIIGAGVHVHTLSRQQSMADVNSPPQLSATQHRPTLVRTATQLIDTNVGQE